MTKKHFLKIAGYYLLLVIGLMLILGGYVWYINKQHWVRLGLCRPNFPYVKYSVEELEKLYPQYPNEKVATVQTPEQTYAKFVEALKSGDVEGVKKLFYGVKYTDYEKIFEEKKKNNNLDDLLNTLDSKLILNSKSETLAQYQLGSKDKNNYIIEFIKDIDGIWKIDSL
ncbi:MAG: hypothetical protein ACD_32C00057G0001 [uncultured bacterium]|uniref:DUF4878 domain-containing protein n=1 Tax=Candidatus Magasanikbacteria bacterium GW2011_GWA2_42_32 TaxID=1619039 RepID=A0A0G1A8I2_9BACT|nr:MAG: hypothetical protein ACD_32C00057G0001 [uncultured bacterium]KKR49030.1 MAG: hypothetical protein UT86_C0001G0002 [Candidatus Magasanikbacteria bacterium GW2011_GWC2_40_17]KKS57362.1 MAG: hypothetical protein UV20_C0001G0002 [Candidatus Magasanikbacteria bacterium GW2011_GWA2_42_32]